MPDVAPRRGDPDLAAAEDEGRHPVLDRSRQIVADTHAPGQDHKPTLLKLGSFGTSLGVLCALLWPPAERNHWRAQRFPLQC